MISISEKSVLSSDEIHQLNGKVYLPECEPIGLLHIVHGMTEHIGRYDKFMREMAQRGYITFGYDHLGHGKTASNDQELGFIAHKDGWIRLCEDVKVFSDAIREEFCKKLPYYVLGHSMGSFIVRLSAVEFITPDKLVVMGTGGPNPVASIGILIAKLIKTIYGEKHISNFLQSMAFGSYNNKFNAENDSKAWLTKDVEIRKRYKQEKLCMFRFTVSAMQDLITLNHNANSKKWFKKAAKVCPILLVSGSLDPVGDNGKSVQAVYDSLKKENADVTLRLYENCRHEILNDDCYEAVLTDILKFLN